MGKKQSKHPGYKKMKDTPWITQGREIANVGGRGILDNYNYVNVFDDNTKRSLEDYNNSIYQRAFNDMNKNYNDIMNAYAARNYNRFGSLNSTPSMKSIDEYQRQFQRQMDDLSYNKAVNYENMINNELQRRYNTLNMFANMYQYGNTPHDVDIKNWNVTNTNRDVKYNNSLTSSQGGFGNLLMNGIAGAGQGYVLTGNPWGAAAGGLSGIVGGLV